MGINYGGLLSELFFSRLSDSHTGLEAKPLSDPHSLEAADHGKSQSQALLLPPLLIKVCNRCSPLPTALSHCMLIQQHKGACGRAL